MANNALAVWNMMQNQELKDAQLRAAQAQSAINPNFDFTAQLPDPPTPQMPGAQTMQPEQLTTPFVPQGANVLRQDNTGTWYEKPSKTHKENVNSTSNIPIADDVLAQLRERVAQDPTLASLASGIDQSDEYKKRIEALPLQTDTTPIARFLDNTFGTHYSESLKAPESVQERAGLLSKIQDSINRDKQSEAAQRLAISSFLNSAGGKEAKAVSDTDTMQLGFAPKKQIKTGKDDTEKLLREYTAKAEKLGFGPALRAINDIKKSSDLLDPDKSEQPVPGYENELDWNHIPDKAKMNIGTAGAERAKNQQNVERLVSPLRKALYGSVLSAGEKQAYDTQIGNALGQSGPQIRKALQQVAGDILGRVRQAAIGYNRVIPLYEQQYKQTGGDLSGMATPNNAAFGLGGEFVGQQQKQKTPPVGSIKNGYKFNGGNPNDQNSWTKQ